MQLKTDVTSNSIFDAELIKRFSDDYLKEIYEYNPPLDFIQELRIRLPERMMKFPISVNHCKFAKFPIATPHHLHNIYINSALNGNSRTYSNPYLEIAIKALIKHGLEYTPETIHPRYLDLLTYIIDSKLIKKDELSCIILLDCRLDSVLEKLVPLLSDLGITFDKNCRLEELVFNATTIHGQIPYLTQALNNAGPDLKTDVDLHPIFPSIRFENARRSNAETFLGRLLCSKTESVSEYLDAWRYSTINSWPEYLEAYFELSQKVIDQSKSNFTSAGIFGMVSEYLNNSHFSSQTIQYSIFFLQAVAMYAASDNLVMLSAGLATTSIINRLGIFSNTNASRAGMFFSKILSGGNPYAAASSLAGDLMGRGLVKMGFWYHDKKTREARTQIFENALDKITLDKKTKETLEKHFINNTLTLVDHIKCFVSLEIPLTPLVTPSGKIVNAEEAKQLISGNFMKDLTWKPEQQISLFDLHPAVQLKNILTCLAMLIENPSQKAQENLFNHITCAKTGRDLSQTKDDEGVFINPEGFFVIRKKTETSRPSETSHQKDIADSINSYFVPNMQSDFFSQIKDMTDSLLKQRTSSINQNFAPNF